MMAAALQSRHNSPSATTPVPGRLKHTTFYFASHHFAILTPVKLRQYGCGFISSSAAGAQRGNDVVYGSIMLWRRDLHSTL